MSVRVPWESALASLLLAFVASMVLAWVYGLTYQGIGYLRSFVQTIALGGMVASIVMLAIEDDVARGIGMVGAMALVRFRTSLKDTRDLLFIFASLAVGVACGVQSYAVAILGTLVFSAVAVMLAWTRFGSRHEFDAVLRFRAEIAPYRGEQLKGVLDKHCARVALIDMRTLGDSAQEYAYHFKLARPGTEETLMHELESVPGVTDAAVYTHDASLEQ